MKKTLPTLETKNLILREIEESDAMDMFEFAKLDYVGASAGWERHKNVANTKEIIKIHNKKYQYGQLGVYAVVLKSNNKMIGTIELHAYTKNFKAELGYTINPLYWGYGYAVEASIKALEYGFTELSLKRIECSCLTDNVQSKRVCEKLLFKFECIKRKGYMLYDGQIKDLICYALTDDDYREIERSNLWQK